MEEMYGLAIGIENSHSQKLMENAHKYDIPARDVHPLELETVATQDKWQSIVLKYCKPLLKLKNIGVECNPS